MDDPIVINNGTGFDVRTSINNAFESVVTLFSGDSPPNPSYSYQIWINTSTTPGKLMQVNANNTSSNVVCTLTADGTIQFLATDLIGTIPITSGGTGQTTQQAALTALSGIQQVGTYLRSDGTNTSLQTIESSDVPILNQNTTGTASNVTGIISILNGGTNANNRQSALNNIVGAQTAGYYLRSDGTNITLSQLSVNDISGTGTLSIAHGGTGANNAETALNNLGALPVGGGNLTGAINDTYATVSPNSNYLLPIGSALGNLLYVVAGSTPFTSITQFDIAQAGTQRTLLFQGTFNVIYNATRLKLPGDASIVVNQGDVMDFVSLGNGNWQCTNYQPVILAPTVLTSFDGGLYTDNYIASASSFDGGSY